MDDRMDERRTPVFLARRRREAEDLVGRLRVARIDAEIIEVIVGEDRRGWQVLTTAADADRARATATPLEIQCYGDWESRDPEESYWGVMEGESELSSPTEIYSAQSVAQAHFLKNLLAEQGIAAVVTNQLLHGGAGVDLVGTPTAAKVVVAGEDAEAAREFALDFDERNRQRFRWPEEQPSEHTITVWPTCPACGAKRTTRCPICKTSGTDFAEADRGFLGELAAAGDESAPSSSCGCSGGSCAADREPAGEAESAGAAPAEEPPAEEPETLLMCTVCDEPFQPDYPKHCEWCGHEFEEGYVVERIVGPEEIPRRAIAVVAVLGLLLIAAMAYFIVILGG